MSNIKNVPNEVSEIVHVNRAQIEHRATWMGLIYDEMIKAGIDAEPILRRAIRRCGNIHGAGFQGAMADKNDCMDFNKAVFGDVGRQTFHMTPEADRDNVQVEVRYCALVKAWQKLGFDDETIALLCDIAMEGDRGIAEANDLGLDLHATIPAGCPACKLHFHKK